MDRDHKGTTESVVIADTPDPSRKRKGVARMVASQIVTLPDGDHTDPATAGLQLRVRGLADRRAALTRGASRLPRVSRTWMFRYRHGKERVRIALGTFPAVSLADARKLALDNQGLIRQRIDPRRARPAQPRAIVRSADAPAEHSIEALAREFMDRHIRPHRKHHAPVQYMIDRDVLSVWRGRDARTIKPREVIELLDGIVDRGSRVQANRVASLLGQMFRFGIGRAIVEDSPVKLFYKPGGKEKPRDRALSDDELQVFLRDPQACTRYKKLTHVMLILLLTGQRRGELARARWRNVDLRARLWTIPPEDSKNGKTHAVPLSAWAVEEFQALCAEHRDSLFVLPGADGQAHDAKELTRSVARCQKRFAERGVAHFVLHDLRRTCRTGLAKLRVAPHIAERVLNHAQDEMSEVYDRHAYLDEKRDALDKWAAHLNSLRSVP